MKDARTILRDAAEVLRKEGWITGHYHLPQGHCAIGAIARAAETTTGRVETPEVWEWDAGVALRILGEVNSRVRKITGYDLMALNEWNDAQSDVAAVISALERAAEIEL